METKFHIAQKDRKAKKDK